MGAADYPPAGGEALLHFFPPGLRARFKVVTCPTVMVVVLVWEVYPVVLADTVQFPPFRFSEYSPLLLMVA